MDDDPIVLGNKRRSQVFIRHNATFDYIDEKESTMKDYLNTPFNSLLDDDTESAIHIHGKNIMSWMDRLVHAEQQKEDQKITLMVKKLVVASSMLGAGRFEDHAQRINYILDNGANHTGFQVDSSDVIKAIRTLRTTTEHNQLFEFNIIKMENYEGGSKNQKYYFISYQAMHIEPEKMHALSVEDIDIPYTIQQFRKDVPDYPWEATALSEDLDKPPNDVLKDDDIIEATDQDSDNVEKPSRFVFKVMEPFKGQNLEFTDLVVEVTETSESCISVFKAKSFKVKA